MGVNLIGCSSYVSGEAIDNKRIIEIGGFDTTPDKIFQVTGIQKRYFAGEGESLTTMAIDAAHLALASAGIQDPRQAEIGQVIVATSTPDAIMPNVASKVAGALGIGKGVSSIDINSACAGFAKGLHLAATSTDGRRINSTLVIGADQLWNITDKSDYKTATLFADGAGAVLLEYTQSEKGMIGYAPETIPDESILYCPNYTPDSSDRDAFIAMDGRGVYKVVTRHLMPIIDRALTDAGMAREDIHLHLYHQANGKMIHETAQKAGIDISKVPIEGGRITGNTSAATLPIALDLEMKKGNIQPDNRLVIAGFGAGMCIETLVWRI